MKHIISLGAGVQSSTMALMAAHGEITPMPDCAIFADTKAEPKSVYKWLDWLEPKLPYPVHRVTAGDLTTDGIELKISRKTGQQYIRTLIPMFTAREKFPDQPLLNWAEDLEKAMKRGILTRKCTRDYKIEPIRSLIRQQTGLFRKRSPQTPVVTQWIGISTDEADRMKPSDEMWLDDRWPLLELNMSRTDCFTWMESHGYPKPPRSACKFCPFHNDDEWIRLRDEEPIEFAEAVAYDIQVRDIIRNNETTMTSDVYLHDSLKPLGEVVFVPGTGKQRKSNECEGVCST